MKTKPQLIKLCTKIAEDNFDNQMLILLEDIKATSKFQTQHKFIMIEYVEADKLKVEDD